MDLLEKAWWNKTWTSILVRLGIRRVPGATSGLGDILYGLSITGGATTADMTLYVDGTLGNDSNSGLVGFPMKTIQAAIDRVPKTVKHNVTINVAAGTYAESLKINLDVDGYKSVIIQGTAWTAVTPATGPASGTFTANDGVHQFTLAAAGWTVNNLAGKMLKITSGAKSGNYYGIVSNGADTIDAGCNASAVGNANFEIVTPGAILTKDASVSTSVTIDCPGITTTLGSNCIGLISLDIGQTASRGVRVLRAGCLRLQNCRLTGSLYAVDVFHSLRTLDILNCFSSSTVSVERCYTYVNDIGMLLPGGYYGFLTKGSPYLGINASGAGYGCLIDGGYSGIYASYNKCNLYLASASKFTIRNSTVAALQMGSSGHLSANSFGGYLNLTNNAIGVKVGVDGRFTSSALKIVVTGCTSDAFQLNSSGNVIDIQSTSSITGNTGFGIKLPAGNAVAYNNIQIGSTVTMNTNTAGDLTLDGTTPITIAALRADPNKTMVDLLRLNRLSAD